MKVEGNNIYFTGANNTCACGCTLPEKVEELIIVNCKIMCEECANEKE